MSYTGEVTEVASGAAVGLAALAVAAVAATAVGAVKAVGAVATAVDSAVKTARFDAISSKLGTTERKLDQLDDELVEKMRQANESCYAQYEKTMTAINEELHGELNTEEFLKSCTDARRKLNTMLAASRADLERRCIEQIQTNVRIKKSELAAMHAEINKSIEKIAESEERKQKACEYAAELIAETQELIAQLRSSESELCLKAADVCAASLERAGNSLENGMGEAALIGVYSVREKLLTTVGDMTEREMKNKRLYVDAKAFLENCKMLIEQNRSINYTFEETKSGQPVEKEIPDFSKYYRGDFEKRCEQLERFESRLAGDLRDKTAEELSDMMQELTVWQEGFMRETISAYERLRCELLRCEVVQVLAARYAKKGYVPIHLTEEDKAVSMMDSIIVRMEKKESGERLCLKLNAVTDGNGHVTMSVEIEDHTEYSGSDNEIERAREAEREAAITAIKNSGAGKKLQLRQRCKNPGVLDAYQRPNN